MLVMKFPAKPTKRYMSDSDQTLTELNMTDQGTGPGGPRLMTRPASMRFLSAALTPGISAGRLRNHGQNRAAQRTPRPPMIQKGVVQVPKESNSQRNRNGTNAPPKRLNVQVIPWAEARCLRGIQSASARARVGKPPAWNM